MKKNNYSKLLLSLALILLSKQVVANNAIDEQKTSYKSLVGLQNEKELTQKNIHQAIKEKNDEIHSYMQLTKELEDKLASQEVTLKERIQAQFQKRELASRIEVKDQTITQLKNQLSLKEQQILVLEDKFRKQDEFLRKMVQQMGSKIERTIAQLQTGKKMGSPDQITALIEQKDQIDEILRRGIDHQKSVEGLERQIAIHQGSYEKIMEHNIALSETLRTAENKIQNMQIHLAEIENEKENMRSELAEWKRYTINLENDYNRKENEFYVKQIELEGKYANTIARIQELEQSNFMASVPNTGAFRMPASANLVQFDSSQSGVTAKLYQGLSDRLKEANLNIKTTYTAGSISIAIEDNFLFGNDSSKISEKSKDRLHNLIVIYTEELFSDPEIRAKISSVEFVGHSSPRYKGVYLAPNDTNEEAYKHNIKLSAERALEVVNYIFSEDFSDFPYKEELRSKTVVSGRGHQEPIAFRQIASKSASLCGPYDCNKSRRVEIIFSLKADESIDN